jgi:hypothetical protein
VPIIAPTPHRFGESPDDLSNHAERTLIGVIGLLLPVLLVIVAAWRPVDGAQRWSLLSSISAYYYTGAVAVFVGMLATLAVFLLSYQGYANRWHTIDVVSARIAGTAAFAVAFFPTNAPSPYVVALWWRPWMEKMHYASAGALFCSFAFFALYLFRRTDQGTAPTQGKAEGPWRNRVYVLCGLAIVASLVWIVVIGLLNRSQDTSVQQRPIFWPECSALLFFAISWLVKGHAMRVVKTLAA